MLTLGKLGHSHFTNRKKQSRIRHSKDLFPFRDKFFDHENRDVAATIMAARIRYGTPNRSISFHQFIEAESTFMHHRDDIQALRALAVIGVVLFHSGVPGFSGGFLGVDVFFAISGFLITGMIIERGSGFRLIEFYERRARRILPALYLVSIACIPLAWYRLMPDALENFGQSLVAVVGMSNNILLYLTSGYWDLASETKPLLHTWSLGVEEQFYLIFPVLLVAASRYRKTATTALIAALAVLSFLACLLCFPTDGNGVFYLPQFRAWELLAGAFAYLGRKEWPLRLSSGLRVTGLSSIAASFILFTPPDSITTWSFTAIPVTGTCLILACNGPSRNLPILDSRAMQLIGATSYSLYLLHQPAFALTRAWMTSDPSAIHLLAVAMACLPLSYLMYLYVETPCRAHPRLQGARLWIYTGITSVSLVSFGLFLHLSHGVPARVYQAEQGALDGQYIAYNMSVYSLPRSPASIPQQIEGGVLVIGNSYARDLANALIEGGLVSKSRILYRDSHPAACGNFGPAAFREFTHPESWTLLITDNVFTPQCIPSELQSFLAAGFRKVIYVGPKHFGRHLDAYSRVPQTMRANIRGAIPGEILRLNAEIASKLDNTHYIDAIEVLTEGKPGIPLFSERGLPLTKDGMHFSKEGAVFFGRQLLKSQRYRWFVDHLRSTTSTPAAAPGN